MFNFMKKPPKENHEFLIAKTTISEIYKLERYKKMEQSKFESWFQDVKDLVNDYSYAELTSSEFSQEHATKYKFAIGYAYLHKLAHQEREGEELGKLGNLVFDKNMKNIFKNFDSNTTKIKTLTGMTFAADSFVPDEYQRVLNKHGAIQVGTEDWWNLNLTNRFSHGAVNQVARNCLTFAINDASYCYTAQYLGIQNDLCTLTQFPKKSSFSWLSNRPFTITARHVDDLKLISECFTPDGSSVGGEKPSVLVYFLRDQEELNTQLRQLVQVLLEEVPQFFVETIILKKRSELLFPWVKQWREEMNAKHHLIIAPCGRVQPSREVFATTLTAPIQIRNQETRELMKHHIEIISHRCSYNLFNFATQVLTFLKSEDPEESRLVQLDSSMQDLASQSNTKRETEPFLWRDNQEILSLNSQLNVITSSKKYRKMDEKKCQNWFLKVVDYVSKNPFVVSRDSIKNLPCDDGSIYPLRLEPHLISMVCLYKFELTTAELENGREKTGQVGTVFFDQSIATIDEKLNEDWQMQTPLSGMIFIAEEGLSEKIKEYVLRKGAIQLATEESLKFQRKFQYDKFLEKRRTSGAAFFVACRSVHFALNINHGCHTEQFIGTKLDIYTSTVNFTNSREKCSVTVTASNFKDLKLVTNCFLPQPDKSYQPKQKSELKILYYLGNDLTETDNMLKSSASYLKDNSNWGCQIDTLNRCERDGIFYFNEPNNEIRSEATKPYSDSERKEMKNEAYDFIIAPPEWVKPSERSSSISMTMPVRLYFDGKIVNRHMEIISQDCLNNPFGYARVFAGFMLPLSGEKRVKRLFSGV